jgi:Ca-activated chloride channel family protein
VTRLLAAALALGLLAQQGRPTFKSAARTVYVYATVQGKDGRLVPNLGREDFQVFEDGKPRPITVFDNTPQKITVAMMFDMSNSMAPEFARIHAAAGAFVKALSPDDRARIGSFGLEVAISPLLTGDKPTLQRIVDEELWPGGPTPLWFATDLAMTSLDHEDGRRVVVLFTDGYDSGFFVPGNRGDMRKHAERGGFMIYAIGVPGRGLSEELQALSEDSGGGHFLVGQNDDLGATFAQVVDELHQQYLLAFSSDLTDGRAHSLRVKTTRSGAKVRARQSYIAGDGQIR